MAPAVARWLDAAPADWEAMLVLDPNATAAQSALFAPALSAVTPGLTVQFLVIERERALLGGGPVIEERRGGFHWLHASMFTLPGTPIARPGEHETVDRAFADALASRAHAQGAVGGAWVLYRPVGPAPVPQALDAVPGETRWVETTLLRLEEGLEPVRRRMDKKTRNELRHAARGRTTFAEEPDAIDEAFSLHQAQARTWGHRPPPLTLLRRLLVTGNDAPLARLFTVRDTRGLLAAAYVLDHVSECFVWWTGAHPHARHENAVSWLFWSIAEWAAARGRARFNLGASPGLPGVAAFKRSLGGESFRYPVRALDDSNARGLARMVAALQRRMRRNRPWGEPE